MQMARAKLSFDYDSKRALKRIWIYRHCLFVNQTAPVCDEVQLPGNLRGAKTCFSTPSLTRRKTFLTLLLVLCVHFLFHSQSITRSIGSPDASANTCSFFAWSFLFHDT